MVQKLELESDPSQPIITDLNNLEEGWRLSSYTAYVLHA